MNEEQELPQGWVWTTIEEVCESPQYGYTTSGSKTGTVKFLRTTDITSGHIDWAGVPYCQEGPSDVEKYLLKDGDIVVSRAGSVGFSHLVKSPERAVFASYLIRFRPKIEEHYLAFFLLSPSYWAQISEKSAGIALQNVNASKLKQIIFPLPPLPEQRRIVAKLEELFSKLDAGVAAVRRTQALLKRYRQSVLHAAVTGELTRAWRAAHPPAPAETGAALLQRIRAERRAQWEAAQVAKRGGQLPLGEGWKAKYAELEAVDTAGLPELPEGWAWASVAQLGEVSGGLTKNAKRAAHELQVPYLRVANVQANQLRLDEIECIGVTESEIPRTLLQKGDLLVVEGNGSPDQIGRVAIWDGSISPCLHQNHLIKLRLHYVNQGSYVLHWLLSKEGRDYIRQVASSTSGLYTLSISKIEALPVPLPPLAEQAEIVAEVERRLTVLDALSQTLSAELKRAERLRQSLLHRAFTGRLVPQQATDEPAAALLARLRETPTPPAKAKAGRGRKAGGQTILF